ncbi:flagellar hook capping FlgD N-terminal domain-containing protein [Tepidibacillus sp. LV47]|uniref:flagellar hook capping FlgD N-terminal domain-containing protein n=1 Tax=Tepidibacillus sp. LV47 TaxID=3398228 RepID=UPI003AAE0AB2
MNTYTTTGATTVKIANQPYIRKDILGKDDFLKIFIAQLKNQDPLQPLQDKDFIAQMAQFSSLEQITNMTTELAEIKELLNAQQHSLSVLSSLIGKIGYWEDQEGTEHFGEINSVLLKDQEYYALIGDQEVPIQELYKIESGV